MKKLFSSLRLSGRLAAGFSLLLLCGVAAPAATLNVSASEVLSGGLYQYTYSFNITGTGAGFDNIFLGSADLSPLNVKLSVNGAATTDWSYLGNDTPQNYLQFYSQSSTALGVGSSLGVSFASSFAPSSSMFAIALNSATGATSNEVTGVLAPTAAPEPASAAGIVLAAGLAFLCLGIKRLAQ